MRYEHHDGGRAAAGFKGEANDCVCRAIAIAAQLPYATVYAELATINEETHGKRTAREGIKVTAPQFRAYLESQGFNWTPCTAIGTGTKVHMRADELPAGRLIVRLSKHLAAVIDGTVYDTHDPRRDGTRAVYGYWRKV